MTPQAAHPHPADAQPHHKQNNDTSKKITEPTLQSQTPQAKTILKIAAAYLSHLLIIYDLRFSIDD
jgi:hypothetical protein